MQRRQPHRIRELAARARDNSPWCENLADTRVTEPVLVRDPEGEPTFWLVPFLRDDMAVGFATVTLEGVVQQVGTFGSGCADRGAWIPASYFWRPPEKLLSEIRERYSESTLSNPSFSYDRSPSRWAWRLGVDPPNGDVVFVAPRDWHARAAGNRLP